jgi:hypothetical protein
VRKTQRSEPRIPQNSRSCEQRIEVRLQEQLGSGKVRCRDASSTQVKVWGSGTIHRRKWASTRGEVVGRPPQNCRDGWWMGVSFPYLVHCPELSEKPGESSRRRTSCMSSDREQPLNCSLSMASSLTGLCFIAHGCTQGSEPSKPTELEVGTTQCEIRK